MFLLSNFFFEEFKYLDAERRIQWVGGKIPLAEPECGFEGEKCETETNWKLILSISSVVSLLLVVLLFAVK